MFDCTCNTQNSFLLNQHNGDDAPQVSTENVQVLNLNRNANLRKYVCFFSFNQQIKTLNIVLKVKFTSFIFALSLKEVVSSV